MPTCEVFVRKLNLSLYEPIYSPLKTATAPERRGFINEIAFRAFGRALSTSVRAQAVLSNKIELEALVSQARSRLSNFVEARPTLAAEISSEELTDILEQTRGLEIMIVTSAKKSPIEFEPHFPGCGFLSDANGDILVDSCLYEVKAGDRTYRSTDLRQLFVYLSLNFASKRFEISRVGLVNPRQGTRFEASIDEVSHEIAGLPAFELLSRIIYAVSSGDVSR